MNGKRMLALLCCVALLLLLWIPLASAMEPTSTVLHDGLDISQYQGEIDFSNVRSAGYTIVYIRAGGGDGDTDLYFTRNSQTAREAGLDFGFYYYVTAVTVAQAQRQAHRFANLIRDTGYTARPAMDFESFQGLEPSEIRAVALSFLETLHRQSGCVPMLYSDAYNARTIWDEAFQAYPLWIAEYNGNLPPENDTIWSRWTAYQYSDNGRVPGISGAVDLDHMTDGVLLTSEEPKPAHQPIEHYVVQAGDTLWAIAQRYGVTLEQLVLENRITNPNLIYLGQVLTISPRGEAPARTYTVRTGDTLWAISRRFGVTVSQLAEENHIANPNRIYTGQILRIP